MLPVWQAVARKAIKPIDDLIPMLFNPLTAVFQTVGKRDEKRMLCQFHRVVNGL